MCAFRQYTHQLASTFASGCKSVQLGSLSNWLVHMHAHLSLWVSICACEYQDSTILCDWKPLISAMLPNGLNMIYIIIIDLKQRGKNHSCVFTCICASNLSCQLRQRCRRYRDLNSTFDRWLLTLVDIHVSAHTVNASVGFYVCLAQHLKMKSQRWRATSTGSRPLSW